MHVPANPVLKRRFDVFLSHAHANAEHVVKLDAWLRRAGLKVWYDGRNLAPGKQVYSELHEAIPTCRNLIVVLSEESVASAWVKDEVDAAGTHQKKHPRFGLIPIRLDEVEPPDLLASRKYIDAPGGRPTVDGALSLMRQLHEENDRTRPGEGLDVYAVRSWRDEHETEKVPADWICRRARDRGLRLVQDAQDHPHFRSSNDRVPRIVRSCRGLLAILPDRGTPAKLHYMLTELEVAREAGLPVAVFAQEGAELPAEVRPQLRFPVDLDGLEALAPAVDEVLEELAEDAGRLGEPPHPQYIFLAREIEKDAAVDPLKDRIVELVELVTGMPGITGDQIPGGDEISELILRRIRAADLVLVDLTDTDEGEPRVNTCIEAGIAMGAGVPYELLAKGDRRRPKPFMLRSRQQTPYADEVDLVAEVHRLLLPYRRMIWSPE